MKLVDSLTPYIIVALIAICFALPQAGCKRPIKLHYHDCVRIEDEFYGVTYGVVTMYNGGNAYTVARQIGQASTDWVLSDNNLIKVDPSFCKDVQL